MIYQCNICKKEVSISDIETKLAIIIREITAGHDSCYIAHIKCDAEYHKWKPIEEVVE